MLVWFFTWKDNFEPLTTTRNGKREGRGTLSSERFIRIFLGDRLTVNSFYDIARTESGASGGAFRMHENH